MAKARTAALPVISDQFIPIAGYANGLRQPSLRFRLRADELLSDFELGDGWIKDTFAGTSTPAPVGCGNAAVERLLDWTRRILGSRHQPVLEPPKLLPSKDGGWLIWHPCLSPEACQAAIELGIEVMNLGVEGNADGFRQAADAVHERYDRRLNHGRLYGFNPLHFVQAAHELGIPWQRFSNRVLQVGIGAASHLLESSLTDSTPIIGSMFARDKLRTARVMRRAGVPVAEHHRVSNAEDAVSAADHLGYPVVVKPTDADGGDGVAAYLHTARSVTRAFARALETSANVMVEKHFDGTDYRFHVVGGTVIGVLERSPGSVTGDGKRSVRELVEAQNYERRTADDDRRHMHPIEMDEEADTILTDTGRTWDTVPAAGEKIRLRGAASVSRGGIPRELDLAEVHPDNLALAVRAARALRLDIAGVDLLLPEIGASWLNTGASICEVNAAPSMFTSFHVPTLRLVMKGGDGRVPVIVVLSPSADERASGLIHARLGEHGLVAGLVGARETLLGNARPFAEPTGSYAASVALTRDTALQALVISVTDRETLRHGWAVDRCDALVLARGEGSPSSATEKAFKLHADLAEELGPGTVFIDAADATCVAMSKRLKWARIRMIGNAGTVTLEELAAAVVEDVLALPGA